MMGPVQVLVVGFDRPSFSGEVLAEFARLREAGIVRLVDLLFVTRGPDGALDTLEAPAGLEPHLGRVAATLLGRPADEAADPADGSDAAADAAGGRSDGDRPQAAGDLPGGDGVAWSLAEAIPVGSAAAIALIEHTWAGPLTAALRRAGGSPLEETWLAPTDIAELESLIAGRD
jgi:hypothetical protein